MVKYPYIMNTGSLKKFIQMIPSVGIPDKVTINHIYTLGFKSVNDRPIVKVLKHIGFLDPSGSPTERYRLYRNKSRSSAVLGKSIKEAYADVFKLYPDAHKKDHETLRNYFSSQTKLGEVGLKAVADTFLTLCSISSFEEGTVQTENTRTSTDQENSETKAVIAPVDTHEINLAVGDGKSVRISIPKDLSPKELEKVKKLIDVFLN